MPKKLVKKIVEEVVKEPTRVVEKAAEQVGVIPAREPEPGLTGEQLKEKRKKDEEMRRKRLAEIEAEIKQVVEKRKVARTRAQQAEELKKREKKPEKPLMEPKYKRPRGLLAGLKRRWEKFHPELAGRRVGG